MKRTRHIELRHHFIQQLVKQGAVAIEYVKTEDLEADALTKALGRKLFEKHRSKMVRLLEPGESVGMQGDVHDKIQASLYKSGTNMERCRALIARLKYSHKRFMERSNRQLGVKRQRGVHQPVTVSATADTVSTRPVKRKKVSAQVYSPERNLGDRFVQA